MLSVANRNAVAVFSLRSGLPRFAATEGGSYLFLDKKVTKNQGLELMSDKFVKAFWSSAQVPPKGAESVCCLNAAMEGKVLIKL